MRCQLTVLRRTLKTNTRGCYYASKPASFSGTLQLYSEKWGLRVNIDKTKIIVFRNGGPLRAVERWYYCGQPLETVSFYKYLGLLFTSRLCWSMAQKNLATQSLKSVSLLKYTFHKCGSLPPKTLLNLFDKMVMPSLLYGAEIWGFRTRPEIEHVQTKFCKFVLGLGSSAPNAAALGDCGRYPIAMYAKIRCVKYWLKLLNMNNSRLPRVCYNMLYSHCEAGRHNWATEVKNVLFTCGFGIVWICQGLGDNGSFMVDFKTRLKDCAYQDWHNNVVSNNRLQLYSACKGLLEPEKYLYCVTPRRYMCVVARLRSSNHPLLIEKGRHLCIERNERLCKYCLSQGLNSIETEFHFVMQCNMFKELREKYISKRYWEYPNMDSFIRLLQSDNVTVLNELGHFIYNALNMREANVVNATVSSSTSS